MAARTASSDNPLTTSHSQYDLFSGTPPHVRHSSTSEAAAEEIRQKINALQLQVLRLVAHRPDGLTRDEIEEITGLKHQTASARARELVLLGLLETRIDPATGISIRRPTRSGRNAEVLFAVPSSLPSHA